VFFSFLRWLGRNLGSLILALILALVVWVSAVVTTDPNVQQVYPRPVTLERIGKDSNLQIVGDVPTQVRVTIDAPQSIWNLLTNNPNLVKAWIDLSGLGPGDHTVPVKVQIDANPARSQVEPQSLEITLEALISKKFPVQTTVNGEPPLGYKKGTLLRSPSEVTVSGPESVVSQVTEIDATIDISGARETKKLTVAVEAHDNNGDVVSGVTITPKVVTVTQPISLEGGYKNVVVKVETSGNLANGYRLTNISVSPPNVTVFSSNPQLVNDLPGYVETMPVNLAGLNDDTEVRVALNLPADITLVGVQSVLVQVSVAAIETSLTISLPVEILGLPPDLEASISPSTIDVIVAGPLPVLDTLTTDSFRAVIDLTGMDPGTYQLAPTVDLVPEQVQVQSILPDSVEVTISPAPTPSPTPAETTSLTPSPAGTGAPATETPQP
jgi:YbbR domain-containing protein